MLGCGGCQLLTTPFSYTAQPALHRCGNKLGRKRVLDGWFGPRPTVRELMTNWPLRDFGCDGMYGSKDGSLMFCRVKGKTHKYLHNVFRPTTSNLTLHRTLELKG